MVLRGFAGLRGHVTRAYLSGISQAPQRDLFRQILSIATSGLLIVLSIWILEVFLPAMLWASVIALVTRRLMLSVQPRLWRRRWLATLVMSIGLSSKFADDLSP